MQNRTRVHLREGEWGEDLREGEWGEDKESGTDDHRDHSAIETLPSFVANDSMGKTETSLKI